MYDFIQVFLCTKAHVWKLLCARCMPCLEAAQDIFLSVKHALTLMEVFYEPVNDSGTETFQLSHQRD